MTVNNPSSSAEIQTVTIVGLGALGTLFGHRLRQRMQKTNLRILADSERIARYQQNGVYSNGELCDFLYVTPQEELSPADLLLVAVKYGQLQDAIQIMKSHVGKDTLILSLLNGISSEQDLATVFGAEKVIDCVAFGMDAVKEGNHLRYEHIGKLCIGTHIAGPPSSQVQTIARFFYRMNVPYIIDEAMGQQMWGKFMLNVGVNQTVAAFGPDYGAIQKEGKQRDIMIAAMREVLMLSRPEGVNLTENDLEKWLTVLTNLNPKGKPSMRQDIDAKRPSEVGLFAETVLALAKKHGMETPVNQMLLDKIHKIEASY